MSVSLRVCEIMGPAVEGAVRRLAGTAFRSDPIGGEKYSRATSIMSSAYKRHGELLGSTLLECLRESPHLSVWRENAFRLSEASGATFRSLLRPTARTAVELEYEAEGTAIPLDVVVYDRRQNTIRSYNVKRGNGAYDGGKRRALIEQLARTCMTLKGYGATQGYQAAKAESFIVFYYGLRSIDGPCSLIGSELDDHFGFPVRATIEAVNANFRRGLHSLIESPVAQERN